MTSTDQKAMFLASVKLKASDPASTTTTTVTDSPEIRLAPEGVDPRTMPAADIVFDPRLLDGMDLSGPAMSKASAKVFDLYKSPSRNKDRHSLLHSRIGKFIAQVRRERDTGGFVKEAVKTTAEQRDLAAVLATAGITAADLAALIEAKGGQA